ncbi:MAG: TRAP transporter small permease subunit [Saprospiraceae bacterium]|nr:TRAP transporter small permease subunit [Saprospiraceae bacterium]
MQKPSVVIEKLISAIDILCSRVGKSAAWLTTVMVIVICVDVVIRYVFSTSKAWMTEFEWHMFALVFLIGAAYTFAHDAHVRVDLFYGRLSEKRKALINITGIVGLLLPWCLIVIRSSYKYAYNSFAIRESSPDPGGLSARYIIKFAIVLGFILLAMQAVSVLLKSVGVLRGTRKVIFDPKD